MSYDTFARRSRLLAWLKEVDGRTLSARQIVNMSGIYDDIEHYTHDRCFDDLKVLHDRGLVGRKGRPARWWARVNDPDELLWDLDGLFAYEVGALDSGIHDPARKVRRIAEWSGLSPAERESRFAAYTADCTAEDRQEFATWLLEAHGA